MQLAFPTSSNATIKNLLIATWDAVGYYYKHSDKVKYIMKNDREKVELYHI